MINDTATTSGATTAPAPHLETSSLAAVAGSSTEKMTPTAERVKLLIKASSQQYDDMTIDSDSSWTIHHLKSHLSVVYPGKPPVEQQKLIYSGKLLEDAQKLSDVIRCYKDVYTQNHIFHLVCPTKSLPKIDKYQINTNVTEMAGSSGQNESSSTDGIRNRHASATPLVQQAQSPLQDFWTLQANRTSGMALNNIQALAASQAYYTAWMQQMYAQYMQQIQQQGTNNASASGPATLPIVPPPNFIPPIAPNPLAISFPIIPMLPNSAEAATDANQQAQERVGAAENAPQDQAPAPRFPQFLQEDPDENQDWLEGFYGLLRLVIFFTIFYLNFSPIRCFFIALIAGVIYLYNNGFLRRFRERNNNNLNRNNNPNEQVNDASETPETGENDANSNQAETATNVAAVAPVNTNLESQSQLVNAMCVLRSIVVGFFLSLLPETPAA